MRGERALITGGAGRSARTSPTSSSRPARSEIVVLDNFVRGRRENLAWALANGPVRLVEGDIRDRELVAELTRGIDVVFHQAALRITQCAAEPRLALEVMVDGTYNVIEAALAEGVRRVVAASSASIYGLAEEFPTRGVPPPLRQRHALRRRQDVQRGPAAQLPLDAGPRLRRAALLQRLRPADGHPRRLHRGARALDGAHRSRAGAADPRRRLADDGLHLHRRRRPREPARRRRAGAPTRSSTSPAAPRRACWSSRAC